MLVNSALKLLTHVDAHVGTTFSQSENGIPSLNVQNTYNADGTRTFCRHLLQTCCYSVKGLGHMSVDMSLNHRCLTHRGNGSFAPVLLKIPGQTYHFAPVLFGQ